MLGPKCLIIKTFNEAGKRMQDVLSAVSFQDLLDHLEAFHSRPQWVGKAKGVG